MLVQYSEIKPNGTEWQAIPSRDVNNIMDDADILNAIEYPTYELGQEDLPEEIENIIGKIQNEPKRIFGYIANNTAIYFGLDEVTEV